MAPLTLLHGAGAAALELSKNSSWRAAFWGLSGPDVTFGHWLMSSKDLAFCQAKPSTVSTAPYPLFFLLKDTVHTAQQLLHLIPEAVVGGRQSDLHTTSTLLISIHYKA